MAAKSFFSSLRTGSILIIPSLILSGPIQGEHSEDEVEDMQSMALFLYILASSLGADSLGSIASRPSWLLLLKTLASLVNSRDAESEVTQQQAIRPPT
jgi:hypothetical protein